MKKYYFILFSFITFLTFFSCKNENTSINPAVTNTNDTLSKQTVDSVALKKATNDMVNLDKPYNETEDAEEQLNKLISIAKKEGKNVFVQAGGNWCIWCLRFNDFVQKDSTLAKLVSDNFIYYHLNYSKGNKNEEVFEKYAPEGKKLGFPFFIIINGDGQALDVVASNNLENQKEKNLYYDMDSTVKLFEKYIPKK